LYFKNYRDAGRGTVANSGAKQNVAKRGIWSDANACEGSGLTTSADGVKPCSAYKSGRTPIKFNRGEWKM